MAAFVKAGPGAVFMGRMSRGEDLLETLEQVAKDAGVRLGRIEALGAVERAKLAYYDQVKRRYETLTVDGPSEITNLTGNVSIRDGAPMVHAHVTLADEAGRAFGGHLLAGTPVFACEFCLQALEGPVLERGYDESTGLPLWEMPGKD